MAEGTLVITISNQVAAPSIVSPAPSLEFISGWHVPTLADFNTLIDVVDPVNGHLGDNDAGDKLKATSTWDVGDSGSDIVGFKALGTGMRNNVGAYGSEHSITSFWMTDEYIGTPGWSLIGTIYSLDDLFNLGPAFGYPQNAGMSIRCLMDDPSGWNAGDTVTDYDGNIYPTVKIGTQVWMAANLATTHYSDGTAILIVQGDAAWVALTTAAMCYYNNVP